MGVLVRVKTGVGVTEGVGLMGNVACGVAEANGVELDMVGLGEMLGGR